MNDFVSSLHNEKRITLAKVEALRVFLAEPFTEVSVENLQLLQVKLEILTAYLELVSKQINLNSPKMAEAAS